MRRITQVLTIRPRVEGDTDRYGNPVVGYGPGVDWPVFAVAPRSSTEGDEPNRDLVFVGVTVYAPADGPAPGPHDLVVWGGEDWQVVGDPGVWDNNPHVTATRHRGIVVNLDRKEG